MESRTNIVLDEELVAKAMAKAGVRTKKAAIDMALRAYVREPDWQGLLALAGSDILAVDYDPTTLFSRAKRRTVASAPAAPSAVKRRGALQVAVPRDKPTSAPRRRR